MGLYINGKRVNPIVSFLSTVAFFALGAAAFIFFLPFLGGLLVIALLAVLGLIGYGVYYRWRYGDPIDNLRKKMAQQAQQNPFDAMHAREQEVAQEQATADMEKTGVRRRTRIEDAVVVEEIQRTPRARED